MYILFSFFFCVNTTNMKPFNLKGMYITSFILPEIPLFGKVDLSEHYSIAPSSVTKIIQIKTKVVMYL